MLRHYEKCGLLNPAKVDAYSGYRLYSSEQIPLLNRIVVFRDMGFSIEEIGQLLDNYDNATYLQKMLALKMEQTKDTIAKELHKHTLLSGYIVSMKEQTMNYTVALKAVPAEKVVSLAGVVADYSHEDDLWKRMFDFCQKQDIPVDKGGIFSIYPDDEYKEQDVEIEIAVPVKNLQGLNGDFVYKELPEIPCAVTVQYQGSYEHITTAWNAAAHWIEEQGYEINGVVRGFGIKHPLNETNPAEYCTEIQIPVKMNRA
jgi:DNA-binding transcriptional MerR regulator/predicted transcriptional regulator YdeE